MKIWAHTLVKNEERFLWYSVMSVINHVDKVLLWDTGSTDDTKKIAELLAKNNPGKIDYREVGEVDKKSLAEMRQKMLDETDADWVIVLDGDEIWWEDSVVKLTDEIKKGDCDAIVSPFVNAVGDMFHLQEEKAGKYKIDGRTGNITISAMRRGIEGLKVAGDYGWEGYVDGSREFIQESKNVRRRFVDAPFLHASHLARSSKDSGVMQRRLKLKYELGKLLPPDFFYPEVFFRPRPDIVSSPWSIMTPGFRFRAFFETPLRMIKRRIT